jgi:hypothetical protein
MPPTLMTKRDGFFSWRHPAGRVEEFSTGSGARSGTRTGTLEEFAMIRLLFFRQELGWTEQMKSEVLDHIPSETAGISHPP